MKKIEPSEFGDHLRKRMLKERLGVIEMAAKLDINRTALSRLLNGHAMPSEYVLAQLGLRMVYVENQKSAEPSAQPVAKRGPRND